MTCTQVVDGLIIDCKSVFDGLSDECTDWAKEGHDECVAEGKESYEKCDEEADLSYERCDEEADLSYDRCDETADLSYERCDETADLSYERCDEEADLSYSRCDATADLGYSACASQYYKKCSWTAPWNCLAGWVCTATTWIANVVCTASTWIVNVVCTASTWIENIVCTASTWIENIVCTASTWIENVVCVASTWISKWACVVWHWVVKWICKAFAWLMKTVCTILGGFLRLICSLLLWIKCSAIGAGGWLKDTFGPKQEKPQITHIFHLMLENRSFDHLFGISRLSGTDVKTGQKRDIDGVAGGGFTNIDKKPDPAQPETLVLKGGAPFQLALDEDDPPHDFDGVWVQLVGNKDGRYLDLGQNWTAGQDYPEPNMQGFVASYNRNIEGNPGKVSPVGTTFACFDHDLDPLKSQLPVLGTLAREFVICDRWFSSLPSSTWPNRFFAHAASSGGLDKGPDATTLPWSDKWEKKTIVGGTVLDGFRFENGTIFDRMDEHCHKWRIFESDGFPISCALAGMNLNMLAQQFGEISDFSEEVHDGGYSPFYTFIEPRYGEDGWSAVHGIPDHYRCGNSMHPLNSVVKAEALIKEVYEAIRSSPHWNSSVLIITFDEHGGFADHVVPETAPPPGDTPTDAYVHHGFRFDRYGVRVPTLIVSPLVQRNGIDGTKYDHTSVLATLERLLGMDPLTDRDAQAEDLLHLFKLKEPRSNTPAKLPDPAKELHPADCSGFKLGEVQSGLQTTRAALAAEEDPAVQALSARPITGMQFGFALIALQRLAVKQTRPERKRWRQRFTGLETKRDFLLFMTDAKLVLRYDVDPSRPVRAPREPSPPRPRPPRPPRPPREPRQPRRARRPRPDREPPAAEPQGKP